MKECQPRGDFQSQYKRGEPKALFFPLLFLFYLFTIFLQYVMKATILKKCECHRLCTFHSMLLKSNNHIVILMKSVPPFLIGEFYP